MRRERGSTRAWKVRVGGSISPSTCAGVGSARYTSISAVLAKCIFGCQRCLPRSTVGTRRRTSTRLTSSLHTTSNTPSSRLASGAILKRAPYVVPSATATRMVLAGISSPPPSFRRASWHLIPHRSRPTDHRYAPNPPRSLGACATPAATSASNPIPSPLLNRTPFTSPVSTLLTLPPTTTARDQPRSPEPWRSHYHSRPADPPPPARSPHPPPLPRARSRPLLPP